MPIDNAIYDRISNTWWEEDGFMALLRTAVNPARVDHFHEILLQSDRPLEGLRVLDVGCGGGLLSEAFARWSCVVTGVDQSAPTLEAARAHAQASGLDITYSQGHAETLPFWANSFDVVVCCDVLEHVDSPDRVVEEIARVCCPNGLFLFDTINRTWRSKLIAITLAQDFAPTRLIPPDVHVWSKFIRPRELTKMLTRHGFAGAQLTGLAPDLNPLTALPALLHTKLGRMSYADLGQVVALKRSTNMSISYMGHATRLG